MINLDEEKTKEKQNIKNEETPKIKNKENPEKNIDKKLIDEKNNLNEKKSNTNHQYTSIIETKNNRNNNNQTSSKTFNISTNIKNDSKEIKTNNNYNNSPKSDKFSSQENYSLNTNPNIKQDVNQKNNIDKTRIKKQNSKENNNNDIINTSSKLNKNKPNQKFDIIEIPVNEPNKIKPKPILKTEQTVSVISTSNKNNINQKKLGNIIEDINEIINKSKAKVESDLSKIEKNKNKNLIKQGQFKPSGSNNSKKNGGEETSMFGAMQKKGMQRYNTNKDDNIFDRYKQKGTVNRSVNKNMNKKSVTNFSNKKLDSRFNEDLSVKKNKDNKIYSTDKYKYLQNDNIKDSDNNLKCDNNINKNNYNIENNIKKDSPIHSQSPSQKQLIEEKEFEKIQVPKENKKTQNRNKYADIDLNNLMVVKSSHKKQKPPISNVNQNPNIKPINISEQYEESETVIKKDNNIINDIPKIEEDLEKNALISKNKELVKAINELKREVAKSKNEINFKDEKLRKFLDNFELISNENAANKAKIENLEEQLFSKDSEMSQKSKKINELLNLNNDLENEMNKMKIYYDHKNSIVEEDYEDENLNKPAKKIHEENFDNYGFEDLQNKRNQLIKNRNELNVLYEKFNNEHERLKYKEGNLDKSEVEDMLTKINNDLMKIRLKLKNYQ